MFLEKDWQLRVWHLVEEELGIHGRHYNPSREGQDFYMQGQSEKNKYTYSLEDFFQSAVALLQRGESVSQSASYSHACSFSSTGYSNIIFLKGWILLDWRIVFEVPTEPQRGLAKRRCVEIGSNFALYRAVSSWRLHFNFAFREWDGLASQAIRWGGQTSLWCFDATGSWGQCNVSHQFIPFARLHHIYIFI